MAEHSDIVGGSSAFRVINCPGSVALNAQLPRSPSSSYADEGTLLHEAISDVLLNGLEPESQLGRIYKGESGEYKLTQDLMYDQLIPAYQMLEEIDPDAEMDMAVENKVSFGDFLPGVFGSADVLGRIKKTAYVIDWKFGRGLVDAVENAQMMFYAAAAMRTPGLEWVFKGATDIRMVIIQPERGCPSIWDTKPKRIQEFEQTLARAVKQSSQPDAKVATGDWCRWCNAKTICPAMNGLVDRVQHAKVQAINVDELVEYLKMAPLVESRIRDLYALAMQMLENGVEIPGYKLVPKRATRKWVKDDQIVINTLVDAVAESAPDIDEKAVRKSFMSEPELISPAQAEKVLKKYKLKIPSGICEAISSGSTMVEDSDPRPAVVNASEAIRKALARIQ